MPCCLPLLLSVLCWVLFMNQTSVEADECAKHCDLYHGHCDQDGVCRCDPGWGGTFCEDCVRMPGCVHGVCHQSWQCMCLSGWAGKFCDKDLYLCDQSNPCVNGAECLMDPEGEYSCNCSASFHGQNCELKRGPCDREGFPCLNGGTCQDEGGYAETFTCRCLAGYVGRLCEMDVDDCAMRPCANGATCIDGVNRFSCQCPMGFQGRFCTVNVNDCAGRPCQNAGRCYDRIADYECYCLPGFTGKSCQIHLSEPTRAPDAGALQTQVARTSAASRGSPTEKPGERQISVKEVMSQREHGLSQPQVIIVVVLALITSLAILLTAALILWYRRHSAWCNYSSTDVKTQYQQCQAAGPDPRKTTEL